jgi:hypothetical protein
MQATVLDVTEQSIYLEVDRQLRFESRYVSATPGGAIVKSSRVNFDLTSDNGAPLVVVNGVDVPIEQSV